MTTRQECAALDQSDELGHFRNEFILRNDEIYLDGNSLGPLSKSVQRRVSETLNAEWGEGLIRSWNAAGWMEQPTRLGDRIAPLIGAQPGEVLVADTLTFLIAKLVGGALALQPERDIILTDRANFHSDLYIIEAMSKMAGRPITVKAIDRSDLDGELNERVALVELTHVDFRTGEALDLAGITKKVHDVGALVLWDFAHSAGAVELDVTSANVDFAAGCGYKYLNGGPGAPAFLYIRKTWQGKIGNPLPGWLGHARPFNFEPTFEAAPGVQGFVTSSPSVIALAALDGALEVWDQVTMAQVRRKSVALTDLFLNLVGERLPDVFVNVTPVDQERRGSQVALAHPEGYAIIQALIARGVIGDFRDPDICRFGFAPLYVRFVDVFDAVEHIVAVIENDEYRDPRFAVRNAVT